MVTKEFHFKSIPTQNDQINDMSQNNIDLLKNANEESENEEDPKVIKSIAKIEKVTSQAPLKMEWLMDDQLVMIIAGQSEIAIFDSLLYSYPLQIRSKNTLRQTWDVKQSVKIT